MPRPGLSVDEQMVKLGPLYLGIDPGVNGGIVGIRGSDVHQIEMPESPFLIWRAICSLKEKFVEIRAVLEQVPHSIFGGAKSSSSKLYGSFKALEMALVAAEIEYVLIPAKKWQAEIGIKKMKGEKDAAWKQRLRTKATKLFPLRNIGLKTADALLIAEVGRRLWNA
jgi:hypothetical protein